MAPLPAGVIHDCDPCAEADLALRNFCAFLLAHGVLATGTVVWRNLYGEH